ncbi:MAG: hypothetical protein WCE90_09610 [Candidatus Zixiibacteriota bacterium]
MRIRLLIALLLLAVIGCSPDIEWSQFEWIGRSIGDKTFDRTAILVPVKLKHNPKTLWMQLDTGADITVVYQIPFSQLKYPTQSIQGRDDLIALSGMVGNCPFDSLPVFLYKDFGDSLDDKQEHPLIGSVGQDVLGGKILVIDFPKRRFYLSDSVNGALKSLLSRASFVDLSRRNNKLFVHVQIADTSSDDFFYDTGASLFPITTSKAMWQKLTGLQGDEKNNIRMSVPSWGQEAVLIGAPAKGELKFGTLRVTSPMVYFDTTGMIAFSQGPFQADGLLGNALFYDEYTVILDLIQNRFGILKDR